MADDAARRLGEALLASRQLTEKQVRAAVVAARDEQRRTDERKRLRSLITEAGFVVRLADDVKMRSELKRICASILEICGAESQQNK